MSLKRGHDHARLSLAGLVAVLALIFASPALAQSTPGWVFGQTPSAAQWNAEFGSKVDYNPSGIPISSGGTGATNGAAALTNLGGFSVNGGTFGGEIVLAPSSTGGAGLNCAPGTGPSAPANGDIWCTTAGLFTQANGQTQQLASVAGSLQVANNGSDIASQSAFRANLSLGTAALINTGTSGGTLGLLNGALTFSGADIFSAGLQLGSPTGGNEGAGTINAASGYYVNGRLVTLPVSQYGAACDGSTNDATALASALSAASALGGGTLELPSGKTCVFNSTLTIPSNVTINLNGGTLKWGGAAAGPMLKTSTSAATNGWGIADGSLDLGGSLTGDALSIDSGWNWWLRDLNVVDGSGSETFIDIRPDVAPAAPATNAAFYSIDHVTVPTAIGTCLRLFGSVVSGGTDVVTDGQVYGLACDNVKTAGVNIVQWADTNRFYSTYFLLSGTSAFGVEFNTGNPSSNFGVYAEAFYGLAIDCFGSGLTRTGIQVNDTSLDAVYDYDATACELGSLVNPSGYDIAVTSLNAVGNTRTLYPGGLTAYGEDLVIGGVHLSYQALSSLSSCTGLGSGGTCALNNTTQPSLTGTIVLTTGSGPSSSGSVTLNFPAWSLPGVGTPVCVFSPGAGSAAWPFPSMFQQGFVSSTAAVLVWQSNSSLTASKTYDVNYVCGGV